MKPMYPGRTKWIAVVLALFGGWFGAHKFYLGKTRTGVLYLIFFWSSIPLLLSIVDAIILVFKPKFEFGSLESQGSPIGQDSPQIQMESTEDWRNIYKSQKENKPLFKSPWVWLTSGFILLLVLNVVGQQIDPPLESRQSTSKPKSNSTGNSFSSEDKACSAMKSADMAVASLGRKVTSGTATRNDAASLTFALNSVNDAYKSLEGDFYWYLVAQGNAIDLLQRSVENEDWYSAGVAIASYLDGDEYTKFCR